MGSPRFERCSTDIGGNVTSNCLPLAKKLLQDRYLDDWMPINILRSRLKDHFTAPIFTVDHTGPGEFNLPHVSWLFFPASL